MQNQLFHIQFFKSRKFKSQDDKSQEVKSQEDTSQEIKLQEVRPPNLSRSPNLQSGCLGRAFPGLGLGSAMAASVIKTGMTVRGMSVEGMSITGMAVGIVTMGAIAPVMIALTPTVAQAGSLTEWNYDPNAHQLEVVLDQGITPSYFLMAQPARIILDLPNTQVGDVKIRESFSGVVQQVRVSQFQPGLTRIVLELSPDAVLAPGQVKLEKVQGKDSQKAGQLADSRWILRPLFANPLLATNVASVKPSEVKAPEAKAPEVKAPEAKVPEAKAPEVKVTQSPNRVVSAQVLPPIPTPVPLGSDDMGVNDRPKPLDSPKPVLVPPPSSTTPLPPSASAPDAIAGEMPSTLRFLPNQPAAVVVPPLEVPPLAPVKPLGKIPVQPAFPLAPVAPVVTPVKVSLPVPNTPIPSVAAVPPVSVTSVSVPPVASQSPNIAKRSVQVIPNPVTQPPTQSVLTQQPLTPLPTQPIVAPIPVVAAELPQITAPPQVLSVLQPTSEWVQPPELNGMGSNGIAQPPISSVMQAPIPAMLSPSPTPVIPSAAIAMQLPSGLPSTSSAPDLPSSQIPSLPSSQLPSGQSPSNQIPAISVPSLAPLPAPISAPGQAPMVSVPPLQPIATPAANQADSQPASQTSAVEFGQPLPMNNSTALNTIPREIPGYSGSSAGSQMQVPSTQVSPTQISPTQIPQSTAFQATTPGILLPAGTVLNLVYPGQTNAKLESGIPRQEVLLLQTEIRDASGAVVFPQGSYVMGRFESGAGGSKFVAQAIATGDRPIPLAAESDPIGGGSREVSSQSMAINSGVGLLVGGLFSRFNGWGLLGGAAAGAATSYLTSPKPATLQPGQIIPVRVLREVR